MSQRARYIPLLSLPDVTKTSTVSTIEVEISVVLFNLKIEFNSLLARNLVCASELALVLQLEKKLQVTGQKQFFLVFAQILNYLRKNHFRFLLETASAVYCVYYYVARLSSRGMNMTLMTRRLDFMTIFDDIDVVMAPNQIRKNLQKFLTSKYGIQNRKKFL